MSGFDVDQVQHPGQVDVPAGEIELHHFQGLELDHGAGPQLLSATCHVELSDSCRGSGHEELNGGGVESLTTPGAVHQRERQIETALAPCSDRCTHRAPAGQRLAQGIGDVHPEVFEDP